jgi:hypothetical protein
MNVLARILKLVVAAAILGGSLILAVRSPWISMTHVQSTSKNPATTEFSGRSARLADTP